MPNFTSNRWSPDTCDCVFDFQIDRDDPNATVEYKSSQRICLAHAALSGPALFAEVYSENSRKNQALGLAKDLAPALETDAFRWSYDARRRLVVSINGLSRTDKDSLTATYTRFGDRVVLE